MRNIARKLYYDALAALPAKASIALQHFTAHGVLPDLEAPKTFSEKVQYRKLHDRDPRLPILTDKVKVKDHVRRVLGDPWVIPTLWSGAHLPPLAARIWPRPFVLKANHGSGWNLFVTPQGPSWPDIERQAESWMATPWPAHLHEWFHGEIDRRLLVEPYMGDSDVLPLDYKFFVFGGRVHYIQVHTDRRTAHKQCFYDREWVRQEFGLKYPIELRTLEPPRHLAAMIAAAETLAADMAFVRVDLYEIGRPFFGEMTFCPGAGYEQFTPRIWDETLGALWP